jgi:hypothetical protein
MESMEGDAHGEGRRSVPVALAPASAELRRGRRMEGVMRRGAD